MKKITGECGCPEQCGRRACRNGPPGVVYSEQCARRWKRTGSPPEGLAPLQRQPRPLPPPAPPPPAADVDDELLRDYAGEWAEADPVLRRKLAAPVAADLARCVQARDRAGLELLMSRFTDWGALAVLLAWCADPVKVAALTGAVGEGKAA